MRVDIMLAYHLSSLRVVRMIAASGYASMSSIGKMAAG
jgi:hypothetical protein